jgi:hypothetical protein
MELITRIRQCIDAASVEDDRDPVDAIEVLVSDCGWDAVRDSLLSILSDDGQQGYWRGAMEALWCAGLDKRPVPADKLIALLYHRFDPDGRNEDNLVWSITSMLKGVGYLSGYRPLEDPGVKRELEAISSLPNTSLERTRDR